MPDVQILFTGPPNQNPDVTFDLFDLDTDVLEESDVASTERTAKGLYLSAVITITAGRKVLVRKVIGEEFGQEMVDVDVTNGTYKVDNLLPAAGLDAAGIRSAVGLESANLSSLVNAIVGKNNVVNNGNGTYNIAVRNATDTATLVTIQFNPVTGAKTVV